MGRRSLTARFWEKVKKTDGCWEWTGARYVKGYGKFIIDGTRGAVKSGRAHRVAWELTNGPIPNSLCVCHRCDNPICVNPEHLFLGSHAENMTDMKHKGRRKNICVGETNGRAKLTEEQVKEILKSPYGHSELGRHFGVSHTTIQSIRAGKIWNELMTHCRQVQEEAD